MMQDDVTRLVVGDTVVAAAEERPRGFFRRKKKRNGEPTPLTHCENCGSALTGPYCGECGQHAIDYRRSLWRVLIDAADSFLNWDTKFLNSIGVLLTRPWKLTNDFNAGRRARYVHPLRLYLLASIAFFLIAKLLNVTPHGAINFTPEDRAELDAALVKLTGPDSTLNPEERAKVQAAHAKLTQGDGNLSSADRTEIKSAIAIAIASGMKDKFNRKDRARIQQAVSHIPKAQSAGTESADPNVIGPPLPPDSSVTPATTTGGGVHFSTKLSDPSSPSKAWIETRIKERLGADGTKVRLFLDTLRSNIPTMMLCCIPLFAFVLKVLYFRKRRYYVEHLVYALHIHTFAYVAAVVLTLLAMGADRFVPGLRGPLIAILGAAAFVQLFLSIQRVYGQGWFMTTLKFLLGSFAYCLVLSFALGVTAFVTLLLPG